MRPVTVDGALKTFATRERFSETEAISHFERVNSSGMFVLSQTMKPLKGMPKLFAPQMICEQLTLWSSSKKRSEGFAPSSSELCTSPVVRMRPVCSSGAQYGGSAMARSKNLSGRLFMYSRQSTLYASLIGMVSLLFPSPYE